MSDRFEKDRELFTLNAGESVRVDDVITVRLTCTSSIAPPTDQYTFELETDSDDVHLAVTSNRIDPALDEREASLADVLNVVGETLDAGGINQPSTADIPVMAIGPDTAPYPVEARIRLKREGVVIKEDTVSVLEAMD